MASGFPYFLSPNPQEFAKLRGAWVWALAVGCALLVGGVLAISYPVLATEATMAFFGVLLLIGSVVEGTVAVWARDWGGFLLHVVIGVLYLFVGVLIIERPLLTAVETTLLLAIFFVASGLFRVVFALSQRFSGWGWAVLNGAVTLLLGLLVWRGWPGDGLWVVGLFVGIELLFGAWSWLMLALALRSLPRTPTPT